MYLRKVFESMVSFNLLMYAVLLLPRDKPVPVGGLERNLPYERAVVYWSDSQSTGHDWLVFLLKWSENSLLYFKYQLF